MLYIDPEGVKAKKKQRKIDFEISDLRLKLANTSGKSIVLSNREIRLLRYTKRHLHFSRALEFQSDSNSEKVVQCAWSREYRITSF